MSIVNNHAMKDYIYETQEYALKILENSKDLCASFIKQFQSKKHDRILFVASGTSYNACLSAKHFFEDVTKIPVSLITAYDYAHYSTIFKDTDFVIAVTHEGESTNTIDAIKTANMHHVDNCVVTEYLDNTCSKLAQNKVTIDCGREFFGPKTKGYVCTLLTLYIMAMEVGVAIGSITSDEYDEYQRRCNRSLSNIHKIISESEKFIQDNYDELIACEKAYVVGYGPHVGTALEGALKSLETVRFPYFSFETEEFLHGPLASVKPDVYTFIIAPKGKDYERSHALYKAMSEQNDHVFAIGSQDELNSKHVLAGSFTDDVYMSVFEYIIPFQLLAYRTFTGKGIDLNVRNYPRISSAVPTKAKDLERR